MLAVSVYSIKSLYNTLSLSFRLTTIFPGGPGIAGIILGFNGAKDDGGCGLVVTTGAI